jgi:hypothetical protein
MAGSVESDQSRPTTTTRQRDWLQLCQDGNVSRFRQNEEIATILLPVCLYRLAIVGARGPHALTKCRRNFAHSALCDFGQLPDGCNAVVSQSR